MTLLLALAAGLVQRAPVVQVREAFDDASPAHRSLTVTASDDGFAEGDARAAATAIADAFRGAPVEVSRSGAAGSESWTIAPRIQELTVGDLPALERGFTTLPGRLNAVLADVGGVSEQGDGAATTATIRQSVQTVRETSPVPLGVIAVAGVIAVGMLARLLVVGRAAEDRLLRSRGASSTRLVARAAVEATWVAVPSVLLGTIVGQAVLWPLYGPPAGAGEVVLPSVIALLGAVGALTAVAVPAAFRALGADADDGSRRGGAGTAAGGVALLLAVGALCTWRFVLAGSAEAVTRDPLALVAPAVDLCALAVLAAALFTPLARGLELPLARGRRLNVALAARLAARNTAVLAAPALLVALAVSVGAVAAGTAATSSGFLNDSARLVNGGAVRIGFAGDTMLASSSDLLPLALRRDAAGGAPDVAPVLRSTGSLGQVDTDVLGVPAAELPSLAPVAPAMFDADAARDALHPTRIPGPVVTGRRITARIAASEHPLVFPDGEQTVVVDGVPQVVPGDEATAEGLQPEGGPVAPPTATLTLWLVDAAGDVAPVVLSSVPVSTAAGPGTAAGAVASATLPPGGPWTIAAADIDVMSDQAARDVSVRVLDLEAGGTPIAASGTWTAQSQVFGTTPQQTTTTGIGTTLGQVSPGVVGGTQVRVMPAGPVAVPVVISDALADQTGLHVGSTTALDGEVAGFQAKVVRTVSLVLGTTGEPAVLADLPTLIRGYLAASPQLPNILEAWTTRSGVDVAPLTGGRASTVTLPSTAIESGFVRVVSTSLWLGAAGSAAFAVLAVAATIATLQRRRRPEVDVLRGQGATARDQARIRVAEPIAVVAYALVAGAVTGVVAAILIVPSVARTSAPSAPSVLPVVPAFDGAGVAALVAAVVVCSGALIALQYRATWRAASPAGRRKSTEGGAE